MKAQRKPKRRKRSLGSQIIGLVRPYVAIIALLLLAIASLIGLMVLAYKFFKGESSESKHIALKIVAVTISFVVTVVAAAIVAVVFILSSSLIA